MHLLAAALLPLAARYQVCNFTCGEEQWHACRAEPCSPRLPEDFCSDGNEATLLPPMLDGTPPPADGQGTACLARRKCVRHPAEDVVYFPFLALAGVTVGGPQDCAAFDNAPWPGSFAERCDLCMRLVGEAVDIVRKGSSSPDEAALCSDATARIAEVLPTVRTCRLDPPSCDALVQTVREHACPETWRLLDAGTSSSAIRTAQQNLCGELMTQRNGSGVLDALVCPVPRDVGARVMGISAVVGTVLFVAQWFKL